MNEQNGKFIQTWNEFETLLAEKTNTLQTEAQKHIDKFEKQTAVLNQQTGAHLADFKNSTDLHKTAIRDCITNTLSEKITQLDLTDKFIKIE